MNRYFAPDKRTWEMRCYNLTFDFAGRWWRLYLGVTFKKKRLRTMKFDGYRLLALRLRGPRIAGIQTRHSHQR